MIADDKVYYRHEQRGGYGFVRKYPAVVVKVNRKTVEIRLAEPGSDSTFTRRVNPDNLSPRDKQCSFEHLLSPNI